MKKIYKNDTRQTFHTNYNLQRLKYILYKTKNLNTLYYIYYIISNSIFIPLRQRFLTKTLH